MGFPFQIKMKPQVSYKAMYGLTSLGKVKAEKQTESGVRANVLSVLDLSAPCSVTEVASETRLPPEKVKLVIKALMHEGLVAKASPEAI